MSQKSIPLRFSDIFSQTIGNFLTIFYTPIIRSYLRETTNFYSVISNCDEVMPYLVQPPGEFLHFTRTFTSEFIY